METKPAIYTTEFWITVLNIVGLVAAASVDVLPPRYAAIATAVVTALYTISRGLAKQGSAPDPAVPANTKLVPRKRDMKPKSPKVEPRSTRVAS